ncbi:EamA family transporter [Paenibacillus piri]|nr:EamA family transporter [Paenibacillus piri]
MGSFGGYFVKIASSRSDTLVQILFNKFLYIGGILYFLSALLNIFALKKLPYTLVLPLTSITYIWTLIISYTLLHEKITKYKISGVIFIVLGSVLIGLSTIS